MNLLCNTYCGKKTFGLYGARLSLAVYVEISLAILFTYYIILYMENKFTIPYHTEKDSEVGPAPGVAVWHSIAMRCADSDTIVITADIIRGLDIFVNGVLQNHNMGSIQMYKGEVQIM